MQTLDRSPETFLRRIDTIIRELEELRKMVLQAQAEPPGDDLAQQLYGALGRGKWDEYDLDLDWHRFNA